MDIFPIWKSTFYETETDRVKFRILKWGIQEICRATAVRLPDDELLRIGLNKPCQNYLDSSIDVDATGVTISNAYAEFSLQIWNESNSQWFNAYEFAFVNDWSYSEHEETGSFSEPINGHAAPGQLIPYTICSTSTTQETICYDEYDRSPYISSTPSAITFNYSGGTTAITIYSNSSWRIVSVTDGYHVDITSGFAGTTIVVVTADENEKAKPKNGTITFVAQNQFGTTELNVQITQAAAPAYFNITSGEHVEFNGHRATWVITYETNLDIVYYKKYKMIEPVGTGTTSGGTIAIEIPESHTWTRYTMQFYSNEQIESSPLLAVASAIQPAVPVEIDVEPSRNVVYGEGTFTATVRSTYDWTAVVPSGITLSRTTGTSGVTQIIVTYTEVEEDTISTVTFTATDGDTTATDTLIVDRRVKNYAGDYLTLEIVSGDTLTILHRGKVQGGTAKISYSTNNGSTWTDKWFIDPTPGSQVNILPITNLHSGSTILLKANFTEASLRLYVSTEGNASFNAKGNVMSLVYGDDFVGKTTLPASATSICSGFFANSSVINAKHLVIPAASDRFCQEMFEGCTHLITPPPLPATEVGDYAYAAMFNECSSLAYAPELPATTIGKYSYYRMFRRCYLITSAPELPATVLKDYCYNYMFSQCRSLTRAPRVIPATTIGQYSCEAMFNGCSSLVNAPELYASSVDVDGCSYMFDGCTSLVDVPATLPATTLGNWCYYAMFGGCTSLTTAPSLPATTLSDRCYSAMFSQCTSLTTAPSLPATKLTFECYKNMFNGCTSLITCPDIPATKLQNYCCYAMFKGCTSLVKAPELPATSFGVWRQCYMQMFYGCSSLNYVKCLITDSPYNNDNTTDWLYGVSQTGTFVKNASMTGWSTGASGIPSGWAIENA